MKYNLVTIMRRAWELRRMSRQTFPTCLRLAWAEAKGTKAYTPSDWKTHAPIW